MNEQQQVMILIVDDDTVVGDVFARGLRGAGYDVRVATSATEGLELARAERPSLVILDFRMPLINGVGFLYRLRELAGAAKTPVIVVTGDIPLPDEAQAQFDELGAHVRFKPIALEELIATTRTALEWSAAMRPPAGS